MDEPVFDQEMSNNYLTLIREGMEVYDGEDKKVGRVDQVYFGEVGQESSRRGLGPQGLSDPGAAGEARSPVDFAFGGTTSPSGEFGEMDEVVRNRLLREGFVRVDSAGLFSSDVYVLPDQIESVSEDAVHLRVYRDDLINR